MKLFPLIRVHLLFVCASVLCSTALLASPPIGECPVGKLHGTIARGQTAVSRATIEVRECGDDRVVARETTGRDGRFAFDLCEGTYDVEVHPASAYSRGGRTEDEDVAVAYHTVLGVGVIAGETHRLPPIDLQRRRTGGWTIVHGMVLDPASRPVRGAQVAVWHQGIHFGEPGTPPRVHTNELGKFVVATSTREGWLQAQAGDIRSSSDKVSSSRLDLRLSPEKIRSKDPQPLDWTARHTVALGDSSGTLIGTIFSDSAEPFEIALLREQERASPPPVHAIAAFFVGNVCMDCVPARLPWEAYAFGGSRFVFHHVPRGIIHVRVRQGRRTAIVSERVAPGITKSVDVHMVGSAAIRATFLRPSGRPLILATICVQLPDFPEFLSCADSDAEGQVRLDQLTAGPRKLSIPYADRISVELLDNHVLDLGTVRLRSMDDEHEH